MYEPDRNRVDPHYLALVLRAPEFLAQIFGSAAGNTTKRRIRPEFFENLCVPLPPLEEQRRIISAYKTALSESLTIDRKADEVETNAIVDLEVALGIGAPPPLPDRPMFMAQFSQIERWSHEGILRRQLGYAADNNHYPTVQLQDVVKDLENGWSPKCLQRPAAGAEWGVLKLGAVSFGTFNEAENKALPGNLTPRPTIEVAPGQVLISRANITRLVGACAIIEQTRSRLMLCDKIFRVVFKDNSPIAPIFLAEVMRTKHVREQIESKVTGTSPTMKNISKPALLGLSFPLPSSVDDQRMLAQSLRSAREQASGLRKQASEIKKVAWAAFEAAVFSVGQESPATEVALAEVG